MRPCLRTVSTTTKRPLTTPWGAAWPTGKGSRIITWACAVGLPHPAQWTDLGGWRSSAEIEKNILTFQMDKKSITKREMEVRSRTEVKYLQVDLYTGPEVSPSRLVHRSWKFIHSLQIEANTIFKRKTWYSIGHCPLIVKVSRIIYSHNTCV